MPARILMRVDLPAPFSPRSATISPAPTSIPASMSACVPPNCFDTPRMARRGWLGREEGSTRTSKSYNEGGVVMRIITALIITLAVSSGLLLAQEAKKVPKDSMRVTVPGCVKGYVFTAGPRTEDQVGRSDIPAGMHLRMNGKKNLISEIRAHEGQMIQITGLMKKGQYSEGINVGGGVRITPGTSGVSAGRPSYANAPTNYIDVESWQR